MKKVYKDPKKLAACLRDIVDFYLDDVITYDKLKVRLTILINANEDRIFKDGNVTSKLSALLGETRVAVINKVSSEG
ncbi:TIGR04540 family protein [Clostridium psychrophilum]|uniref:TIGR04540 family protein n=1 Tax=Clostridium psychrophilum TaxID=132926 RepID=UPI001C0AA0A2|nr:TIGR04540 family protein [Clostridium psychrophilum]MBU3181341.1 TIGR04540 family protein [Clostridium psychrophilum]